uniref:Thioredoxin H9 n=1 Tax=Noccaea caerulescens TaxID=107243 RepID=A0A1J3D2X2_NOCCA
MGGERELLLQSTTPLYLIWSLSSHHDAVFFHSSSLSTRKIGSCRKSILLYFRRIRISRTFKMGSCVSKGKEDDDSVHNVEFSGGNVHLITTKESWDEKLAEAARDGKIVIANFSATWCGPCKIVAPFYIELSEKHPSLMFLIVDVDELSDFSSSWDIKATPTFFFLKNGAQIGKLVGANKPELQKKITSIIDSVPESPQRP